MKNENGIGKSAILKGQTLVNVIDYDNITLKNATDNGDGTYTLKHAQDVNTSYIIPKTTKKNLLKPNTKYLLAVNIIENNTGTVLGLSGINSPFVIAAKQRNFEDKLGWQFKTFTTNSDISVDNAGKPVYNYIYFGIWENGGDLSTSIKFKFMLIEYQQDMENWDIPYFEGMQSVKMPVLTTCGKNMIYQVKYETLAEDIEPNKLSNVGYGILDNSDSWTLSFPSSQWIRAYGYDLNGNYTENFAQSTQHQTNKYIIKPSNNLTKIIKFKFWTDEKPQLEKGTQKTSYEPHKSNILSTPSDLELKSAFMRDNSTIRDEINLLTGELKESTLSITLNGSENWALGGYSANIDGYPHFTLNASIDFKQNSGVICKFPFKDYDLGGWKTYEGCAITTGSGYKKIMIRVNSDIATSVDEFKEWLKKNPFEMVLVKNTSTIKTVVLTIQDQDNQPQERMRLFPNGHINTSSSTFPPILELKGITHNNKLNMTTTNGTNNTQLATLDNLALDGIICRDGTVVRDSYDVESGLYTKRVFRFTIDEEFVERYRDKFSGAISTICFEMNINIVSNCNYPSASGIKGIASNIEWSAIGEINRVVLNVERLYIRLLKEELKSYDVDGLLDWIKRNGAIEVAYQLKEPQIIHMQPNMTPYVSTRPYQGSIESQGNILESSFLDYTSEQSIISPKPLGDGDVLRWEQGSQCYVYENDKEYIPLTDYNQPMGTVLDLEEEDGEQFVENLDGGDIIVDVPFKEKAVYERHLVPHEDNVIYPTQDKLDPTGKIEVDYICGETWQNPNDLADIRHVGTLREDGQYDVTIRRSGDDEIRLMDGTTHLSLDGNGINPSEFELTFFNSGGVEVGKYGDTSHTLEDCVLDSKLETGTVYGETLVNLDIDRNNPSFQGATLDNGIITLTANCGVRYKRDNFKPNTTYTLIITITKTTSTPNDYIFVDNYGNYISTVTVKIPNSVGTHKVSFTTKETLSNSDNNYLFKIGKINSLSSSSISFKNNFVVVEGDYTSYPIDIPYFEGLSSTIVNGFTSCGKNLLDYTKFNYKDNNDFTLVNNGYKINFTKEGSQINLTIDTMLKQGKHYIFGATLTDGVYFGGATLEGGNIKWISKDSAYQTFYATTDGKLTLVIKNTTLIGEGSIKDIYLYEGQDTVYEPYKGITYTLPTPITLNKVGDVADTYDVVSGVETRKLLNLVFDGSNDESWAIMFDNYGTAQNRIYGINVPNMIRGKDNNFTGLFITNHKHTESFSNSFTSTEEGQWGIYCVGEPQIRLVTPTGTTREQLKEHLQANPLKVVIKAETAQTIQHTLIPSTVETMQEPTFILPQPLRSVPNGICDRLYWDENKGHYCIEKRVGYTMIDGTNKGDNYVQNQDKYALPGVNMFNIGTAQLSCGLAYSEGWKPLSDSEMNKNPKIYTTPVVSCYNTTITTWIPNINKNIESYKQYFKENPTKIYHAINPEIIDLPHLNKKLTLPTQPDTLPIGYKVECQKANPQLGLTIPYKQLNYPSRPQNIDFKMDIADYVLTWDDVKEARQYNVILNDRVIATVKEPQWNSGEEMYGYIMVEAQNELAENLSEELYIKTVPNAPAQLTVAHNPMTDYYDFEISFIKTSAIAEYYTVQYRIDDGEWVYKTIQSDEIDPNSKVLWRFSVYEINEQIEVWATATNDIGTNDILPTAIYYMSPTPQWTYRVNSKELFVRWMDESPYDTQYKLRYQYKSDGIFRYAYFEGDKQEIGKLYEALIPLADDEEVSIALCVISEKENLYTKPIKASKELDPNIKPPKNFNYHWLARGLIEFYWEDNYDVDVQYEAIVEHRMSGEQTWITDTRIFDSTDVAGVGTVYRLSYQLEELEEIRVKVRMKWAMNETEWSESLTTVFIPVEGNPPTWIRRTQTQQGLLVEWEPQQYVDSYHVYVMSNGEELQHLETMDNFIIVDLDYSNPIDIEIYEATRFTGGVNSDPSDKMCFRPTMDKQQMIYNVVTPDTLTYEIEVNTIQKAIKERQVIHDINTTPNVKTKEPMDVAIKSPFTLSYHPLRLDVNQAGAKYYGDTELHIKTLDVKSRDAIEVLSFERVTDQYGVDFTVYTPSASKYPITLEVNRVRIVCFGDSLTSGHPGFWAETGTGDPQHCYEYWLDRRLKGQYEIINKGYGSDTTDRMLARFDRDVLANNPQYCIIQGGTNDLYWAMAESMGDQEALDMKLDVMKANIMEMVKRCWDNNIIPIVGNLIPRTGATGIYKTALYDFNAWIISWCTEQAAEGRNIFYVDLFNAGKEAVPPTPIEDPTNPGAMNPIYDGDALFDEFGNIIKQGRGIHLNKEGYRIWAEAIPLSIFKTYDSGLRMYKDLHCTDEDNYDDSDKQNPFYTISIDNVRRSKTKTVVRYVKNIGKTQVLFAMYASDEYNMSIEFVGSEGEKGAYANGLLAPNMVAKVTMEINLDNKDSKANFNLHLAAREYNQN